MTVQNEMIIYRDGTQMTQMRQIYTDFIFSLCICHSATQRISQTHWEMLHSVQHDKRNLWSSRKICVICVPVKFPFNSLCIRLSIKY